MKNELIAAAALLAFSTAASSKGLSKEAFQNHAFFTQEYVAELQVCGARYAQSYNDLADTLNETFFSMLDAADVELKDPGLHHRKIEALRSLRGASEAGPAHEKHCGNVRTLAEREVKAMNAEMAKLTRHAAKAKPVAARQSSGECSLSADYYGERFKRTGKVADLTCFQKAGMRELNSIHGQ